ncbi:MAG: carboxylesterase family protein [Clostridiales bacterium]|nr:carboxylesterase family protein [Clostridiales bacterium]
MKNVGFWIVTVLTLLLMLTVLELNKSRVWGFLCALLLAAAYVILYFRFTREAKGIVRFLCYLGWIGLFAGLIFLAWPATRAVKAVSAKSPERTDVVMTDKGPVSGVKTADGAVEIFAGIPYAKPPVGELRFKEPVEPDPWSEVLIADTFAPMSMQPTDLPIVSSLKQIIGYHDYKLTFRDNFIPPVSEDSLYVNVWRPAEASASPLPVLVYIHGGSLQTGQPWYGDYSGSGLAREGVIVVNMGYRLGVFGFLALDELIAESPNATTGNYGLLDQIMALQWVRKNIAAFGGDPDCVTLAGESAGAACVSALCVSPLAKGLFKRAILESSTVASFEPPHSYRSFDDALESGRELMTKYGVSSVSELRALPAEKLVGEASTQHHITADGYALTENPYYSYKKGEFNETAILHGFNSRESGPFIILQHANLKNYEQKVRGAFGEYADEVLKLYPAATDEEADEYWAAMWGALFFDYSHYCLNRLAAENGIPVYEYFFTKENGRLGSWHSGELIYFYGNLPIDSKLFGARDYTLQGEMKGYYLNFIKTGDPNGEGLPEWRMNASSEDVMELGEVTGMTKDKKIKLYEIIDKMTGWEKE